MKPKWYQPFSRFRKFAWIWAFVAALAAIPGVFIGNTESIKQKNLLAVIVNFSVCWWAFDQTWEKKEEDIDEG